MAVLELDTINSIYGAFWDQVMTDSNIEQAELDKAFDKAENIEGENMEEFVNTVFTITEDEELWNQFKKQSRESGKLKISSDDLDIWRKSYCTGESIADFYEQITHNGSTYEKQLRYVSFHEVTNYKTLVKKELLRGSAKYSYNETTKKIEEKTKQQQTEKEDEKEINPLWISWASKFGSQTHGLREDMLGTHSVTTSFDQNHQHESTMWEQKSLFDAPVKAINNTEPKKYTGRVKNPMWEIWTKEYFKKLNQPITLEVDHTTTIKPSCLTLIRRSRLNTEPDYWVWPCELEKLEKLKPEKKNRSYRIPRSKVRSKSAAFFNVKQSKKFMAFYTVSFPAGIPDDLAYKLFNTWLTRLRNKEKGLGLSSYLWVAERQEGKHRDKAMQTLNNKRKNALAASKNEADKKRINNFYDTKIQNWKPTHAVHFHLLTNNYMTIWTVNDFMRSALKTIKKRTEYSFLQDFDISKYNGVDVKFVGNNRKKLGYYLTKYITKNEIAIEHAVWHCSRNISALFTEQLAEEDKRELMFQILQEKYLKKEGDKLPVFRKHGQFVDKVWIPPWILAQVNPLLSETNQQIYDLFNTNDNMVNNLRRGYKNMPLSMIWKELKRLIKSKKSIFRKERLQAIIKVTKRLEMNELFEGADRQLINNRLITLKNWAQKEDLAF